MSLEAIAAELSALRAGLAAKGVVAELGEVNWTYDADAKHVEAVKPAQVIIMGFNAGGGGTGSEGKWKRNCEKLSEGFDGFMLAELILIASHNVGALKDTHGDLASLIQACSGVNKAIIAHHRPKVIIHTGFTEIKAVQSAYGLFEKAERPRPDHSTHTLLRHFTMADGTPWLSIKHPSSMGFSNQDVAAIRSYARQASGV
jgi:hypothetical protein